MTTDEAYDYTMEVAEELAATGIRLEIEPSKRMEDPKLLAKYSGPERVRPEKWVHVHFFPATHEQSKLIAEKARHLGWMGIYFDTGGFIGQRDWECDWSFKYTGQQDPEAEEIRNAVEELIDKTVKGKGSNGEKET
jgi:hypothetical protein